MAGNAEVIKEFLAQLGFRIDESSFKKFDSTLGKATRNAFVFGASATAAAAAVEAFVARVSESMDRLYFASKRTGASAEEIGAFVFAVSQLGGTSDDARASMENLARFMRTQPGAGGFLTRVLGVSPEHLGDTVKTMQDLSATFQRLPVYLGEKYANMLGIDEKTFLAMRDGSLTRFMEQYNAKLAEYGLNAEDAAARGHDFMQNVRGLENSFTALATRMSTDLNPAAERFLGWTQAAVDWVGRLDKQTGGLGTTLTVGLVAALGAVTAAVGGSLVAIGGWAVALVGVFTLVLQHWEELKKSMALGSLTGGDSGVGNQLGTWLRGMVGGGGAAAAGSGSIDPMAYFRGMGWSNAQAAGIVANLQRESGLNPSAAGDNGQALGVAQWHPDRQAAFRQWAGHDIRQSTLAEQLAFVQYELTQGGERAAGNALRGTVTPFAAADAFARLYERPANLANESALRGRMAANLAAAPSVSQHTEIHVHGSDDPQATADAVAGAQHRVNSELMRNIVGAAT
jgi:hypothetical protein